MATTLDTILKRRAADAAAEGPDPEREYLDIGGVEYPFPKTPPMGLVVELERRRRKGKSDDDALDPDELDLLLRLAVGNEIVDLLYKEAFELSELPVLLKFCMSLWSGDISPGAELPSGEAPALGGGSL